jgi:glutamate-1-semialdehyde 2,1-aminomutase
VTTRSEAAFERARQLMPGGVNSPVRAFRSVGGTPRFIQKAKGALLTDVDGKEYIDYIGSWGAMIAGHAHPQVVEALKQAVDNGTSYGTPCPLEIDLAEEVSARVPAVEKVRMVNSGTEAVMSALRLARAATGRNVLVKLVGCYHGHADAMLVKAGSGVATFSLPDSPGVPPTTTQNTLLLPYNDTAAFEEVFATRGDEIAGVILEPITGNMGVILPEPGFLETLRRLTTKHGALLIFDEVMTGFRVHRGSTQALYGIRPDITTFGKVIGGGVPVGAYAGSAELMDMIAPVGPVYQAGTLSGNPLAMSAGLATLQLLDEAAYERLEVLSARLHDGLVTLLKTHEMPGVVQRQGSMLTLFFESKGVRNFDDAKAANHSMFSAFFSGMLERGVHLPPSGYEAWFLSLAHDEALVDRTLEAADSTLAAMKG